MAANLTNMTRSEMLFLYKDQTLRTVVGVSCSLSILGSLLIILSYILFKKRRTRAREILLHISLMDLGVALANLIGLSVYFDQYYASHLIDKSHEVPTYIDGLCRTQAFFAAYCTYGSILWTIALAGFLYFLIIHHKTRIAIYFFWFSHIVCYVLPLLVSLWLVLTKRLGYSPMDSSGWCTLINRDLLTRNADIFITVFGNDLWIYLAIVTIPTLYLSIRCYLANQMKEVKDYITPKKFWSSLHHVDYKFLIIPVVFVFLRVWTGIMNILYLYLRLDTAALSKELNLALLYLSGIGDSSQGFANAILFVIFTKNIRDSFLKCICCGKRDNLDANYKGQIQEHSCENSQLIAAGSSDGEPIGEMELSASDEVSLVFGSLGSHQNFKSERCGQYGAAS